MSKTPEQMAVDYANPKFEGCNPDDDEAEVQRNHCIIDFLAGYQAAKEEPNSPEKSESSNSFIFSNGWISVKERLPEKQQFVLLCFDERVFIGYYHKINDFKNTWFDENGYAAYPPTHWMPLPSTPTKQEA